MWATRAIELLQEGKEATVIPHGGSMKGKIESGSTVILEPIKEDTGLDVGDMVLCKVKGNVYIHLIKAFRGPSDNPSYLIGNNKGGINGWTKAIYGKVKEVK